MADSGYVFQRSDGRWYVRLAGTQHIVGPFRSEVMAEAARVGSAIADEVKDGLNE